MSLPEFNPATLPLEEIAAAIVQLAAWQAQLAARLLLAPASVTDQADDTLLTTAEVAAVLRRDVKYVYRHTANWPFSRRLAGSRSWVYSKRGLDKWLARQRANGHEHTSRAY
jgi:hypothetical protein